MVEVLISSVIVALIVIATLTGLDFANKTTSLDRQRAQADQLAQQNEDELRSEPVSKLSEISRTKTVTENGTVFTITTTASYKANATETKSCSSTTPSADYIQTVSKVTWPALGSGRPVVESGLISPPAGTALIVQVTNPALPVEGALVQVTGPMTVSAETSADGCAILALLPGEYSISVSKPGFVDPNGFANSSLDIADIHSAYLIAETTTKLDYDFGLAGALNVHFSEEGSPTEGDSFVAFNPGQSAPRPFGTLNTYHSVISSEATMFPFTSEYTVYAGDCEADLPTSNGVPGENPHVAVGPGATVPITVPLGPVHIKVMSGLKAGPEEGAVVAGAAGSTTDTGCVTKRTFTTTAGGGLPHPGLPFAHYTMCVGSGARRWEGEFSDNSLTGPTSTTWTNGGLQGANDVIYLGIAPSSAKSPPAGTVAGGKCP